MNNENHKTAAPSESPLLDGWAMIISFLRRIFCRHLRLSWVRTIHGDEIIACGYRRTVMNCDDCGKFIYHPDYITRDMAIKIYKPEASHDQQSR